MYVGGGLWSTGLAMAKYFQSHSGAVRHYLKRLMISCKTSKISALELGSGNGFLSVCLASLARDLIDELVVTDLDDHLALMNETINANTHIVSPHHPSTYISNNNTNTDNDSPTSLDKENTLVNTIVMEHRWGEFHEDDSTATPNKKTLEMEIQNGTKTFDFIFGSDIAYREYGYLPLIASFQKLFHQNTVGLVGITMVDTKPKFFQLLSEAGFTYNRLADHLMAPEFRNSTFGLFVIQKKKQQKQ